MSEKKQYKQSFRAIYTVEFPCIAKSKCGINDAHCDVCDCDFSIAHGGKTDIVRHISSAKHKKKCEASEKTNKIASYFSSKESELDSDVTKAECIITSLLVEHNIPMTVADHFTKAFKKAFKDSKIAQKYSCGRTKSSTLVGAIAHENQCSLVEKLKVIPFSVAIDGTNDSDSKLHPVVVTYFDCGLSRILSCLLAFTNIKDGCTGINISKALLEKVKELNIPFSNCIGFSCDNAPVMLGGKNGVQKFLKEEQEELIVIGCPCHLLNLAAKKAVSAMAFNIDQAVIDIFYYLEFSEKRKNKLKMFQMLHDVEVRRILKHVSTRWLSLSRCLERLLDQWDPLTSFFLSEVNKQDLPVSLKSFKIPKVNVENKESCTSIPKRKIDDQLSPAAHKKIKISLSEKQKISTSLNEKKKREEKKSISNKKNDSTVTKRKVLKREENIFYFISSNLNKAYCAFILYNSKKLEKINILLQSNAPLIHCLKQMLIDLFENILMSFIQASYIKDNDIFLINFWDQSFQKKDEDLNIGSKAQNIILNLTADEKTDFFSNVRKYYIALSNYIVNKFPLKSEFLEHAEVADLSKISSKSFSSVKYFIKKFPFLLIKKDGESEDDSMDELEQEFCKLQVEKLEISQERMDVQVAKLNSFYSAEKILKYEKITRILLAILSIPHSNAECERVFSLVKKNRTQFRSSMSDETLEKLLIIKSNENRACYEVDFSKQFLNKAKSATAMSLKKE